MDSSRLRRSAWYWMPPVAWAGLVFILSSQALPALPVANFEAAPTVAHTVVFAVLSLLLFRALYQHGGLALWPAAVIAFLVSSLYGASDELHQFFVPNRTAELADWIADTVGAAVVFPVARFCSTRQRPSRSAPRTAGPLPIGERQ